MGGPWRRDYSSGSRRHYGVLDRRKEVLIVKNMADTSPIMEERAGSRIGSLEEEARIRESEEAIKALLEVISKEEEMYVVSEETKKLRESIAAPADIVNGKFVPKNSTPFPEIEIDEEALKKLRVKISVERGGVP